jgi:hypothetical protein
VRAVLRASEHADGVGAAGVITADGDGKPCAYARVLLA